MRYLLVVLLVQLLPTSGISQEIEFDPDKEKALIKLSRSQYSGGNEMSILIVDNGRILVSGEAFSNLSNYEILQHHNIEIVAQIILDLYDSSGSLLGQTINYKTLNFSPVNWHCSECLNKQYHYEFFNFPIEISHIVNSQWCEIIDNLEVDISATLYKRSLQDPNSYFPIIQFLYGQCNEQSIWPSTCYDNLSTSDNHRYKLQCGDHNQLNSPDIQENTPKIHSNTNYSNHVDFSAKVSNHDQINIYNLQGQLLRRNISKNNLQLELSKIGDAGTYLIQTSGGESRLIQILQ